MPVTLTRSLNPTATESISTDPAARARSWLHRLLAGHVDHPPIEPFELSLPGRRPVEFDAAYRAIGCRDLFAIDCSDGIVRERVMADVARTAATSERVLVLSPDPAAADRLTEALGLHESFAVVRALADDENPLRPNPGVNRFTSAMMGAGRFEQLQREAAAALGRLEGELAALASAEGAILGLRPIADRVTAIDREAAALSARRVAIESEVAAEAEARPAATSFAEEMQRSRAARDAVCLPIAADRDDAAATRNTKESELMQARRRLNDATRKPGFLSRLLGLSRLQTDPAELEKEIHKLEGELQDLSGREAAFQADYEAADGRFARERDKRVAAEVAARRTDLDGRLAALAAEREEHAARLAGWTRDLERAGVSPLQPGESTDRVAADLGSRADTVRTELHAARARCDDLRHRGPELARQRLAEAAVVVGTPGSLRTDPVFEAIRDSVAPGFGLLILDHAEELTEADFLDLSPLADRRLLAGDSARGSRPHATNGHRPARHPHPQPGFFKQLVHRLDREPWTLDGDRLVCRLVHLTADQRRGLTCEPVLDCPEIELRVSGHGGEPVLAEIAFPADTSIAEVKRFLVTQLGEVLLRQCGECRWHAAAGAHVACWPIPDNPAFVEKWIELEAGVKEKIVGIGAEAFTAAIAFDAASGWDRARAEEWLNARLPRRHSRVAVLPPSSTARRIG